MKSSDVKLGTVYAVTAYSTKSDWSRKVQVAEKFTAESLVKVTEKTRWAAQSSTKTVTKVQGKNAAGETVTVEAKAIFATWDEVVEYRESVARSQNNAAAILQANRADRDPKVAALEAFLASKGVEAKQREYFTYGLNEVTGETIPSIDRWKDGKGEGDAGFDHASAYTPQTVLDRNAIVASGKVTLDLDVLVALLGL